MQKLVDRHPACGRRSRSATAFCCSASTTSLPLPLEVIDASTWSEETLRHRLEEEAHRPFDLERGPLVRMHSFRLAPTITSSCWVSTTSSAISGRWFW